MKTNVKKMFVFFGGFLSIIGGGSLVSQKSQCLMKPTGRYGVGYEDAFLVNPRLCPDQFYEKGVNEEDFSPDNKKRCHEISLRLIYPSRSVLKLEEPYSKAAMTSLIQFSKTLLKLPQSTLDSLNPMFEVKTYFSRQVPIDTEKKFPLIVFMPGSGMSVHSYSNILTELVSHGYAVLGVNSLFANGIVELGNGHFVRQPHEYKDFGRTQSLEDLKWVLEKLKNLPFKDELKNQIDFQRIAFLGHSMGAMSIVNLVQSQAEPTLKCMVLLDPGNVLEGANYPIRLGNSPSLLIWSSKFKHILKGSAILGQNHYEAILTPAMEDLDFSNHQNFSDLATLQYHPVMQVSAIQDFLLDKKSLGLGTGNGYEIAELIHRSILHFLDQFLTKESSSLNQSSPLYSPELCRSFDKRVQMVCQKFKRNKL